MEEPGKIELLPTLLLLSLTIFIIIAGVLLLNQQFNRKLYRQRLNGERLRALHQQELLRANIRVQEDERRNIARNLHDELGAALSMTRMQLVHLGENAALPQELKESVQKIREMADISLATMRRISHELVPPQLETFGLVKTLQTVAAQLSNDKIAMEIQASDDLTRPSLAGELGLYRICMELIGNTLRHSGADRIVIRIAKDSEATELRYSDNGSGFDTGGSSDGLGLKNIEARAQALGGTAAFSGAAGKGMQAIVRLPLN
jgi:signal transduction histidine kinase